MGGHNAFRAPSNHLVSAIGEKFIREGVVVFHFASYLARSVPGVGLLGAIVGAAGAGAKNLKLLKDGKISQQEAIIDTGKETVGAGVATAISAAAVGAVGAGFATSLGVAVIAAVAGKYAWDRCADYVEAQIAPRGAQTSDDELLSEAQREPRALASDDDFLSEVS